MAARGRRAVRGRRARAWACAAALAPAAWSGAGAGEPTPLDAPLPPGETVRIVCPTGEHMDTKSELVSETYTYKLRLPADYGAHERRYPAMFLAAPGGDAEMGAMARPLTRDRWLVAMLVESRNGTADWLPNFECAYDDLMARTRAHPGALFCSGLSGAARVCSAYPALRPGFRGMILQSAGPWGGRGFMTPGNENMVIFATFGALDFNFHHAMRMRLFLPRRVARSIEIFDGGHEWAPPGAFARALDWVLEKALVARPFDPALADVYRWHLANRIAAWERVDSDIERYAENETLQALAARWGVAEPGTPEARALSAMAEAADELAAGADFAAERAAWRAWSEARARDDASRGRDLPELAAAWAAVAESHAGTVFAVRAAARARSVRWETGAYP